MLADPWPYITQAAARRRRHRTARQPGLLQQLVRRPRRDSHLREEELTVGPPLPGRLPEYGRQLLCQRAAPVARQRPGAAWSFPAGWPRRSPFFARLICERFQVRLPDVPDFGGYPAGAAGAGAGLQPAARLPSNRPSPCFLHAIPNDLPGKHEMRCINRLTVSLFDPRFSSFLFP